MAPIRSRCALAGALLGAWLGASPADAHLTNDPCALAGPCDYAKRALACRADHDGDGVVDQDDLDIINAVLAQPGGPTLQDVLDYDIDSAAGDGFCQGVLDEEDALLVTYLMGQTCPCNGADVNADGVVDQFDADPVLILQGFAANDGFCKAEFFDLDNSGTVDIGDLILIMDNDGCVAP